MSGRPHDPMAIYKELSDKIGKGTDTWEDYDRFSEQLIAQEGGLFSSGSWPDPWS